MNNQPDILIIGGGIIGLSAAYFLAQTGASIVLVEKGQLGAGSSHGNAGFLCPCHSTPLPGPGVLTQGMKWLFDAKSPFYIKPRVDKALWQWLWQFQKFCNHDALQRAIVPLRDMQRASQQLYRQIIANEKIECHFQPTGGLMVYKTERAFSHAQAEVELMIAHGLPMETLKRVAILNLEPALHPDVVGGIHYFEDAHLDPALFVAGLAQAIQKMGVEVQTDTAVRDFTLLGQRVVTVHTSKGDFYPQQVVLAAGVWSAEIAKKLNLHIPMQAGKGYSITMHSPALSPKFHLHLAEAGAVITPLGPYLRYAGTMELAGVDTTLNQNRIAALKRNAGSYLADQSEKEVVEIWGGLRPIAPDGLPYIGRTQKLNNLTIATGHAMLGMSMGPVTGKLVAEIIAEGRGVSADITAFQVDRFS